MKYLLLLLLSGCGIAKNMDNMNAQITKTVDSITELNGQLKRMVQNTDGMKSSIHLQTLDVLLKDILSPENTKNMSLTNLDPILMIPSGKAFSELASTEELCGVFFLWLSEINAEGKDLDKLTRFTALEVMAAFIPESKVQELIDQQLGGKYESTVFSILSIRALAIDSFLLEQGILTQTLTNPAQYEQAMGYIEALKNLQALPFKDKIKLNLSSFEDSDFNQEISLKNIDIKKYYEILRNKLDKELDKKYINDERIIKIKERLNEK